MSGPTESDDAGWHVQHAVLLPPLVLGLVFLLGAAVSMWRTSTAEGIGDTGLHVQRNW